VPVSVAVPPLRLRVGGAAARGHQRLRVAARSRNDRAERNDRTQSSSNVHLQVQSKANPTHVTDLIVERLTGWIPHDDLDLQVIIKFVALEAH
jgi:hypothetical protein